VLFRSVVFRAILGGAGNDGSGHILVTLPSAPLPHWLAGITLGGAVTAESILAAACDGLRLATLLCCIGAANALANPKRALRVLPGALYELGVAVVVAVTVAPQLIESVQRVRRARRLRAGEVRGRRALRGIAAPVLHDALSRSLLLAAAMDSRGYGRSGHGPARTRRATAGLVLGGLVGLCVGAYGLLDSSVPAALGLPMLVGGALSCGAGVALGGRRVDRTSYRPDPWQSPEWIVVGSGFVAAAIIVFLSGRDAGVLNPSFQTVGWPGLPWLPALGIAIALLPAVATPPPPHPFEDDEQTAMYASPEKVSA
jgi:energy-coupling factor transport system permease protein